MGRIATNAGNEYGQLSFDFYSMIFPEMRATEAVKLFEDTKHCNECGKRVFDMYLTMPGEIGIEIKCRHCDKIITIPVLTLVRGK